ncbi:MAG TPA: hypothetical protein VJQ53_04120 [Candidatus Eisenbacteria bacterium]|nr:hypothetical protein [Candidatus Eisenbacteria bacterium]
MGKIAWGRVFLGGLVAGVLWWIFEGLVHGLMLGQDWMTAMTALGKSKEQMDAGHMQFMAIVTVWSLLAGILGVWLYAAIRPRFGPGPKTAMIAAVALWMAVYLMPSLVDYAMALWPAKLTCVPVVTSFFESIIATLVGASLYKEA